ncbi:MAG: carbonic anhydrase family protein [Candidatus Binatia bacterium]
MKAAGLEWLPMALALCLLAACTASPAVRAPANPSSACQCTPQPSESPCAAPTHETDGAVRTSYYAAPDLDHGLVQSPVNILSGETIDRKHAVAVHYSHESALFIENKGHTVEVDFPRGSSIDFDARTYELKQLHFHTPSEHQVDGVTYPMEMHIVNVRGGVESGAPPEFLVVSFLFRMGRASAFLDSFLDLMPATVGGHEDLTAERVYVDDLLPPGQVPSYFHYVGSLTTPPYSETVEWLVLKQPIEASPRQIQRINAIEGDNARHVQALYGRTVER